MENNNFGSPMVVNHILLNKLRKEKKLTFSDLESITSVPEGTIKNIILGYTRNPGGDPINKLCKALGISVEAAYIPIDSEVSNSRFENQCIKENESAVMALKEMYEHRIAVIKSACEEYVKSIKEDCARQISDVKEHCEQRLKDKDEHIETQKLDKRWFRLASVFSVIAIVILFLFIEFLSPGHGWLRIENSNGIFPYIISAISVIELVVIIWMFIKKK